MNVKTILAAKGSEGGKGADGDGVIGIERTETLAKAIALLAEHRVGALVVFITRGNGLAGILSERDTVQALAKHGAAALEKEVRHFMTEKVQTCAEDESVADLMERMTSRRFRHLPAVSGGRLIGMVSIGDVVKQRVEEIEREAALAAGVIAGTVKM